MLCRDNTAIRSPIGYINAMHSRSEICCIKTSCGVSARGGSAPSGGAAPHQSQHYRHLYFDIHFNTTYSQVVSIFAPKTLSSSRVAESTMPHATSDVVAFPSATDEITRHLAESILTLQQTILNIKEDVKNGIAPSILLPIDPVSLRL
jgi:hypothetical protein